MRTNIDQYLTSGTCALTLSGPQSYSETVQISPAAATSTCQGWDIPLSKLKPGSYQISITLNAGGKAGKITGEVKV